MANDAPPAGPVDKAALVATLNNGDSFRAQSLVDNVQDHKLFMNQIALTAKYKDVPGLVITQDENEQVSQIKSDRLTITDKDGELTATANNWSDAVSSGWAYTKTSVAEFFTSSTPAEKFSFQDCWETKATTDSCANRVMDARIDAAEGRQ